MWFILFSEETTKRFKSLSVKKEIQSSYSPNGSFMFILKILSQNLVIYAEFLCRTYAEFLKDSF